MKALIKANLFRRTSIFFGLCFFFISINTAHTQSFSGAKALDTTKLLTQFMVDSWTTEQGLSNNSVMAQLKASDGYFWLATYGGLVRFDGFRSKVYKQGNTPALSTNSLLSIYEDAEGTIWLGTNGKGALHYRQGKFAVPAFNDELPNGTVTSFAEDSQKDLWIGTRKGLLRIRNGLKQEVPEALKSLNIYCLYTDSDGVLWIGTLGAGLWEYRDERLRQYSMEHGLSGTSVRSIKKGPDGKLWIGTEEGVCMMMQGIIMPMSPEHSTFVNGIDIDAYGTVWFGTDAGLLRYAQKEFELLDIGEKGGTDAIQTVFCDEQGNVWLGTYHQGFMRLRDGKFRNYTSKEGLPNQLIHVLYPEQDKIWIGTDGGLALLEGQESIRSFSLGKRELDNRIRAILRRKNGDLFLGTYGGLYVKKGESFKKLPLGKSREEDTRIRRLVEDEEGNLWVGTNSGLFCIKKGAVTPEAALPELGNAYVMALCIDQDKNIWVGTNGNGVFCLKKEGLRHYKAEDGLASDVIFDIFSESSGKLWFMTNNGISRLGKNGFSTLNERNGLFANTLFQLLQDKAENFWFTTNRGVFQVSATALNKLVEEGLPLGIGDYKHYTKADGLLSTGSTPLSQSARGMDGRLWFASLQGVSAIDPIRVPRNLQPPLNKIEKVVADNKEYSLNEPLRLQAGSRYFEFHYTGINYSSPGAVRFRYQLENFEEVWHDAGTRREAYYNNLPPGTYRFKVMAANEDGVWSDEAAALPFKKEAYFYETIWFRLLVFFLFAIGAVLAYLLRVRKLKKQNATLNTLVEKRTLYVRNQHHAIEEQKEELKRLNNLKDRLLSIISHDLRGPLTSTMGILNLFHQQQITESELRKFSGDLSQSVGYQVNMLDNLLNWARSQMEGFSLKPVQLNLYQVVEEIFMLYRQDADRKTIKLVNQLDPSRYVLADKNLLQLVIRNLLVNALKFTNQYGTVAISASFQQGVCQVEVVDNGMGMSREQLAEVFRGPQLSSREGSNKEKGSGLGLTICKEFVEKWGGKIWAESYEGKGSRFKFTLKEYLVQAMEE